MTYKMKIQDAHDEGKAEGILLARLYDYKLGDLTLEQVMEKTGLSEEEIKKRIKEI